MGSQQSGELASYMRELDERGYTVVAGLLPRSEAEEAAEKLLALSVEPGPGGDSSMFGNLAPADWPIFQSMATHPVSLEMAEFALGPGFKMIGDIGRLWAKPGDKGQQLHADLPVSGWWAETGRRFPADMPCLQTIWALTDFTADNGATNVVPYTHRAGRPPRADGEYQAYTHPVEMAAGSVAFLDCALWHRRGANMTGADRVGLSIPYVAQWLDPVTTWHNPMPRPVWEQMPEAIRRLNPHTAEPRGA
jgi:ectoine hydroxylase-related dioxygenase (phytanoyl-CoA dioxygenase family)